jgi:hypothetical protein
LKRRGLRPPVAVRDPPGAALASPAVL